VAVTSDSRYVLACVLNIVFHTHPTFAQLLSNLMLRDSFAYHAIFSAFICIRMTQQTAQIGFGWKYDFLYRNYL